MLRFSLLDIGCINAFLKISRKKDLSFLEDNHMSIYMDHNISAFCDAKNDYAWTIYIKLKLSTQNPSKPVSSGTAAAQLMEETSHVSLKTMQGINEV